MSRRRVRLGEQLRRELSLKIATVVRDPEVGPLAVTDVEVTADLWLARVYVAPQGTPEEQGRTMTALARSASFLRSTLARELRVRRMPELRFLRDGSAEAGSRIEKILKEVLPPEEEDQMWADEADAQPEPPTLADEPPTPADEAPIPTDEPPIPTDP